ncbi:MAG: type II secretion system protein [Succinivibrionaceae bacterium]|nr:type II secretion system protein [Succinivibrionaceae bacterium]
MIKKVRGFTLIEIIIGIVVLSIALTGGLSLLISQVDAYRDPLIKEKSVQIAKRVVHEIQIRAYDEKSDIGGGIFRCSETVGGISLGDCSAEAEYGTDPGELMLDTLDDVDDFDTVKLCPKLSGSYSCSENYLPVVYFFSDAADEATQKKYNDYYAGFLVKIEVVPAKISGDTDSAKKITVTVRQSDGLEIEYSLIKANI